MKRTIENNRMKFSVELEYDHAAGAPWENSDTHGDIRDTRDKGCDPKKLAGELAFGPYMYDYAGACKIALRDDWGCYGWQGAGEGMTRRQFAAEQARQDYERLRAWCNDEWHYVGVVVTLLDIKGNETDAVQSLWGIESDSAGYLDQVASELADECANDAENKMDGKVYTSGSRSWIVKE